MARVKALDKNFKPKIIPIIQSSNTELLNLIQYPVYLYAYPKGVKILIRSGHMRFENGEIVRNMSFKHKLEKLLTKSRNIKVTLECIVSTTPGIEIEENEIYHILRDLTGSIEQIHVTILDMVFEHSPEALDFTARTNSLKVLFRSEEVGKYPKIANTVLVHSRKEFENLILVYNIADSCNEFIIASPKSKYKFGVIEDLFLNDGGIAKIDTKTTFSAQVMYIHPKIINIRNKNVYVAKSIEVNYKDAVLEIELDSLSVMVTSKIWENRKNLTGQNILFSGTVIPGYEYPKYRSFIRFEKFQ